MKYQVRVCFDKLYETLKEYQFDNLENANSFYEKAVKRAKRIGYGKVALFKGNAWCEKSTRTNA